MTTEIRPPNKLIFQRYAEKYFTAETEKERTSWLKMLRDFAEEVKPEDRIPAIEEAAKRVKPTQIVKSARESLDKWKEEQEKYKAMGLSPRYPEIPIIPPEPTTDDEIFIGMAEGLEVKHKEDTVNFFRKQLREAKERALEFGYLMAEEHKVDLAGYLEKTPYPTEREYRDELYRRFAELRSRIPEARTLIIREEDMQYAEHLHPILPPEPPIHKLPVVKEVIPKLTPEERQKLIEQLSPKEREILESAQEIAGRLKRLVAMPERWAAYKCPYCDRRFRTATEMRAHTIKSHPEEVLPYKCPHCPMRFETPGILDEHIKYAHKEIK